MILSDYHLHSSFSGDCKFEMKTMIDTAISLGVQNLCFTEHHDIDFECEINFLLDFEAYTKAFYEYQEAYKKRINILLGVELGVQPHIYTEMTRITKTYPFDFILCSNHLANGVDPYLPVFFEGKTKKEAYLEYFEDILRNVKNYSDYDSYGHLDYAIRYGPYEDKHYLYADFQEVLDEILKTIIAKGRGIELNASGFKYKLEDSLPSYQVIRRYKELGGEIITVGSDAHRPEQLLNAFDQAEQILLEAGFRYYTIFKGRKPEFVKLG